MLELAFAVPTMLLSVVLLVSGLAKARDRDSVRESFITLRLPPRLSNSPAPALLPWGELILAMALLLLWGPAAVAAGVAALALFVAYLVIIIRATRFDRPVECGCLGRLGLGVVGPVTVVRNALLVVVAVWVLFDAVAISDSVLWRWINASPVAWVWLVMAGLSMVLAGLMVYAGHDDSAPADPLPSLPTTSTGGLDEDADVLDYERVPIPYIFVRTPTGTRWHLRKQVQSQARLMVFVNPDCGSCIPVLQALPSLRERVGDRVGVHVVLRSVADADSPFATAEALGEEWFTDEEGLFRYTFQLRSPSAVLLGTDGALAGGPVSGTDIVIEFFEDVAEALTGDRGEAETAPAGALDPGA